GFSILFFYDPALYFKYRSIWTMYDNEIEVSEFGSAHRFTSTLSDPNNIAALICAVVSYIVFNTRVGFVVKVFVLLSAGVVVVGTMSTSGGAHLLLILVFFLLNELLSSGGRGRFFILKVFSVVFMSALVMGTFVFVSESIVGQIAIERAQSNSMDSRFDIWAKSFVPEKLFGSLVFGDGGLPILDGRVINPHNGHIYLIYSYGFVFYVIFLCLFFYSAHRKASFKLL